MYYIVNMKAEIKNWKSRRVDAINRKIKRSSDKRAMAENYIEEHYNICNSKAKSKKEYKNSLAYVLAVEKNLGFELIK
tara:strand:+ start:182 stop:415 length:234 start_codon:yes stop_codon:yes gene_type:complete